MDPWTILGISASIIQLIDVGYELVSGAKEVYSSGEGMKRQTAELRNLARDIQRQNEQIIGSWSLSKDEKALKSLLEASLDIAQKLDAKLAKLVVQDNAKFRRLQSAKVSVKAMYSQSDLEELKKRLLDLQAHVQRRLSTILKTQQHSDLASAIRQLQGVFKAMQLLASTQQHQIQDQHEFLMELSSQIILTVQEGQMASKSQQIIGSLWFNELKEREDGIEKAHEDTLGWLFEPSITNFVSWLEHGNGVFWMNGLAGSGKSTLMKFAFREERTVALLKKWANGRQLHIANFFFWNSGFEIQKSQRGLLQSLLCQIFRSDPDLVSTVCPNHHPNEPWSIDDLQKAYEKLRGHVATTSVFCFFIDGLDEYSGEEAEIIGILKNLSQIENVKICASSRPWNSFEKAFSNPEKTLIVEEHTMADMKRYVKRMLEENSEFRELSKNEPRCLEFIPEIAHRARGVWLWVYLVVKDLMKDIEGKEDYEFLKRRLDDIPPRLEAYFEDIINRVPPIYKDETAKIFLLTTEAVQPLPLFALSFLEMETRDPNYAMTIDLQKLKDLGLNNICETWRFKLKSRCRDLLKTKLRNISSTDETKKDIFSPRVEYLHRTVRDFLLKNHQTQLFEAAGKGFDAKVSLSRAMLAMLQMNTQSILASERANWTTFNNSGGKEKILPLVHEFLYYSLQLEISGKGQSQFGTIDMVEKVTKSLFQGGIDPWDTFDPCQTLDGFLLLLIELGLYQYVRYVLDTRYTSLGGNKGAELLRITLTQCFSADKQEELKWTKTIQDNSGLPSRVFAHAPVNLDFIEYLFERGADARGSKALSFLIGNSLRCLSKSTQADRGLWFKISELLVQNGARLDDSAEFVGSTTTIRDTIVENGIFTKDELSELERIAQAHAKTRWSFWSLLPQRFS